MDISNISAILRHKHGFLSARVISREKVNQKVTKISLRVSNDFSYIPGQFLDIIVPSLQTNIKTIQEIRAGGLSIVSVDKSNKGKVVVLYARKSFDPTIKWLIRSNVGGDTLIRSRGSFVYTDDLIEKDLMFIAGGMGIVPLYSILKRLWDNGSEPLVLYFAKKEDDFIFIEDLKTHPLVLVTTQEFKNDYYNNRINQELLNEIGVSRNTTVLFCGPQEMIKSGTGLLKTRGVRDIRTEKWV